MPPKFVTISQAATAAGLARGTVHRWAAAGQIPGAYMHPVLRAWLIPANWTMPEPANTGWKRGRARKTQTHA